MLDKTDIVKNVTPFFNGTNGCTNDSSLLITSALALIVIAVGYF